MECFYDKLHLSLQITNHLYGFDFEDDKLRIKPELRVMMAENQTQSKSKWTEHETIPRDTFYPASQDETSNVNEN